MIPTRALLEAALEGFDIQRKAIEAKQSEIREALKSPVEVMAQAADGVIAALQNYDPSQVGVLSRIEKATRPKRKMSAAGRAAISKATKARWAKYRKEQNRA